MRRRLFLAVRNLRNCQNVTNQPVDGPRTKEYKKKPIRPGQNSGVKIGLRRPQWRPRWILKKIAQQEKPAQSRECKNSQIPWSWEPTRQSDGNKNNLVTLVEQGLADVGDVVRNVTAVLKKSKNQKRTAQTREWKNSQIFSHWQLGNPHNNQTPQKKTISSLTSCSFPNTSLRD